MSETNIRIKIRMPNEPDDAPGFGEPTPLPEPASDRMVISHHSRGSSRYGITVTVLVVVLAIVTAVTIFLVFGNPKSFVEQSRRLANPGPGDTMAPATAAREAQPPQTAQLSEPAAAPAPSAETQPPATETQLPVTETVDTPAEITPAPATAAQFDAPAESLVEAAPEDAVTAAATPPDEPSGDAAELEAVAMAAAVPSDPAADDGGQRQEPPAVATTLEEGQAPAAGSLSGQIARAQFTSGMAGREPVDDLGTHIDSDGVSTRQVSFFTDLRGLAGKTVYHRWEYEGEPAATIPFKVRGDRWRVHSSKLLPPGMTGAWQVVIVDEAGNALGNLGFRYE